MTIFKDNVVQNMRTNKTTIALWKRGFIERFVKHRQKLSPKTAARKILKNFKTIVESTSKSQSKTLFQLSIY